MTKVKELLRESRQNATNDNKQDLDKMFNMKLDYQEQPAMPRPGAIDIDATSKFYFDKIVDLRMK